MIGDRKIEFGTKKPRKKDLPLGGFEGRTLPMISIFHKSIPVASKVGEETFDHPEADPKSP